MSNIPTNKQLKEWYEETLLSSSFIETLTAYQKDKLLQFTVNKIKTLFQKAVYYLDSSSESNYPKNLPMENWLNHIIYRNMGSCFNEANEVLNLFSWNWTLEKNFFKSETPMPEAKKILSENEAKAQFYEILKHPLFVLELNEYEKSKILEIAFDEQKRILTQSSTWLKNPLDTSILNDAETFRLGLISNTDLIANLEDVPGPERLYYFLTEISYNAISLKVLFQNLGVNWNLHNGQIRPAEELKPDAKIIKIDLEINDNWKNFVLNGGKLKQPEIALLCYYEGVVIPKPSKESAIAENIALWHGHKSGNNLYNLYDEMMKDSKRLYNRTPNTMKGYLEKIKPLISEYNQSKFKKDFKEIENQM
tara:strand:- start:7937 stop:9028 length:1092 start_codon:yes stop_codon:yes gene_type:complete